MITSFCSHPLKRRLEANNFDLKIYVSSTKMVLCLFFCEREKTGIFSASFLCEKTDKSFRLIFYYIMYAKGKKKIMVMYFYANVKYKQGTTFHDIASASYRRRIWNKEDRKQ